MYIQHYKGLIVTNIVHNFIRTVIAFCALFLLSACEHGGDLPSLAKSSKDGVNVAVLLPTSGQESNYYTELNKMIKLGLSDGAKGRIKVTSYDSSTKNTLAESLEQIVANNTDIIIGPIYSEAAQTVAARVKNKNTTIISLSNNPVLSEPDLFVFGHAPMRQLEHLVDQLLLNQYKNYITLLPSGRYSQSVSSILKEMITSRDATLARVEYYNDTEEDIARAMRIVSDNVDNLNEVDYNLTRPVVLLADDPYTLEKVFGYAKQFGLDNKAVIAGDGRINIKAAGPLEIIYTGAIGAQRDSVRSRASGLGVTHLGFMHELAYDAGRIVAENVGKEYNKQQFISAMQNINYQGLSGRVHFTDSIAQRHYDVIRRNGNNYSKFGENTDEHQAVQGADMHDVPIVEKINNKNS